MTALPLPAVALARPRLAVTGLLAVASAVIVAAAWGFELIGGFVPCKLCLIQREPYYIAIPLAALAFLVEAMRGPRWLTGLILLVLVGLFVWGGSVGGYQAGAEWGWWQGPTDCGATRGAQIPASAGDLLGSLGKVKIVDCDKPQIRILGLSFAGWNVLTSTGLVVLALAGLVLSDRPRRD